RRRVIPALMVVVALTLLGCAKAGQSGLATTDRPSSPFSAADAHSPAAAVRAPITSLTGQRIDVAGHPLAADIFKPTGRPLGAVILAHGFTRSRTTLNGHAAALAADGALALTVDMPCTFDFACNARALAGLVKALRAGGLALGDDAARRSDGAWSLQPVDRVVLVGFSAGALSSLLAADTPGVVGYVGLDPFDRTRPDGQMALGMTVAPTLHTPAVLVRAAPSRCNAQSAAAPWAGALRRLQSDTVIDQASHCDFESPSDWICAMACGAADPGRQQQVRQRLQQAVQGWLGAAAPR
ncbi:MAG: hypothetical protein ACO305_18830, partial [Rubrivivax sp.]